MELYIKSIRNNGESFSQHRGMDLVTVKSLLTELGCTEIQEITREEFLLRTSRDR